MSRGIFQWTFNFLLSARFWFIQFGNMARKLFGFCQRSCFSSKVAYLSQLTDEASPLPSFKWRRSKEFLIGLKNFTSQPTWGWVHGSSGSCLALRFTTRKERKLRSTNLSTRVFGLHLWVFFWQFACLTIRLFRWMTTKRRGSRIPCTTLAFEFAGATQSLGLFLHVTTDQVELFDGFCLWSNGNHLASWGLASTWFIEPTKSSLWSTRSNQSFGISSLKPRSSMVMPSFPCSWEFFFTSALSAQFYRSKIICTTKSKAQNLFETNNI